MPLGSSSDAPVTSPGPSTSITERSLPTRSVVTGVSADSPWPTLGIMLSVLLRLSGGVAIFGAAQPQTANMIDACLPFKGCPQLGFAPTHCLVGIEQYAPFWHAIFGFTGY